MITAFLKVETHLTEAFLRDWLEETFLDYDVVSITNIEMATVDEETRFNYDVELSPKHPDIKCDVKLDLKF